MSALWQDLRYAARTLARTPSVTIVAVLTLALGIGANAAVFSLVNGVLIRPLPFTDPDRLAMISEKRDDSDHHNVSAHEYVAWRDGNRSLAGIAMYSYAGFTLDGRGEPTTVTAQVVTANFFDVLGEQPLIGRAFRQGDDAEGAPHVALLGRSQWTTRFASDSSVVGKRMLLDDIQYQIIGVMDSRGDMDADVWVPLDLAAEARRVGKHSNVVIARLAPGVSLSAAQSDLELVAARLAAAMPAENAGHSVRLRTLNEEMFGDVRRPMLVALGAAAFVLLLACANVGHLLLTRAAARQKELAIRAALGASRARIIGQLLTESLLLSSLGGLVGLVAAAWCTDLLPAMSAIHLPRIAEVSLDSRVLVATLALSVLAGLVCGVVPGLRSARARLQYSLNDASRGSAAPGKRIAGVLVSSEVAIALVLLVGAALTVKSFAHLLRVDPGFDPNGVLSVSLPLPGSHYAGAEQQRRAVNGLLDRLDAVPGVVAAGATTNVPLGPCCNTIGIEIEGRPPARPGQDRSVRLTITSGRYFDAMRIPVRRGRVFDASDARVAVPLIRWFPQQPLPPSFDVPQAAPVAVISEATADTYWPNENVIGKRFRILFSPWITVVGVVGDVRQTSLMEPSAPQVYLSDSQEPSGAMTLVIRTARDPLSLASSVRRTIRSFDARMPIGSIESLDRTVWTSIGRPRFNALLLGASGLLALLLAVIGIYGVISYAVAQRTHEIGIRRALGAQTHDVLRLVLGHAGRLIAVGIVAGTIGAVLLTRLIASLLFGVSATDPVTFALVAVLLTAVALLASYLPGRRAARVDPSDALRS